MIKNVGIDFVLLLSLLSQLILVHLAGEENKSPFFLFC